MEFAINLVINIAWLVGSWVWSIFYVASKGNEKRGVVDRAIVELEKEEEKRISTGNCE